MYHISNKFNSCNIFEDIYERTVAIVNEILDQSCGYYVMDNEKSELVLYREKTKDNGDIAENKISLSQDQLNELNSSRKHFLRGG